VFWGLSAIKLDAADLKEVIRHRDALKAYTGLARTADAAQKLQKPLSMKLK